ncbi:MAG: arsenite methyltransferase [Armatimonadetes bacterium]|nr:arsenite methyltransferase [Armatimonadota bacterium]
MIRADEIKKAVREHYVRSLSTGCCGGGSSCCATTVDEEDRPGADLEGLTGPSLGCGRPLGYAQLQPGEIVVDLGSGAGREVLLAAREVGPAGRAIGIDMTPEMVWRARENANQTTVPNAEFRLGEIEHLPVPDAAADVVISNCVINLVPDKSRAFAEAYRILKPGGRLIVSDMVARVPLPGAMRENLTAWAGCVAGAVDVDEYLSVIERAGFRTPDVLTRTNAAPGHVFSITLRAVKP